MTGELEKILDLLEKQGSEILLCNEEGDCLYYDGEWCLGYEEGYPRIHDRWRVLSSRDEALKILEQWFRKGDIKILIDGLSPGYEDGIDWFT